MQMTTVDKFLFLNEMKHRFYVAVGFSAVDHRSRKNVLRTPVTHSAANHVPLVL